MRNSQYQTLYMDFDGLRKHGIYACDIDMCHVCLNGYLILCEIKNEQGTFDYPQRRFYEQLVDNNEKGGAVLYATHNKFVQNGAESVDVSKLLVREYYFNGKWRFPSRELTVREAIEILKEM